jgi:hypothetical protein
MSTPATPPPDVDPAAYARARRKVRQIKGVHIHVTVFCIVIAGLFLINYFTGRPWWFIWPAIGWGIGLAFHAFGVYGTETLFGSDWEERKMRELIERERRKTGSP